MSLLGLYRPFDTTNTNRLQLASEFSVLVIYSLYLTLTDLVMDIESRSLAAWCIIGTISLVILVNYGFTLATFVIEIKHRIKLWFLKRAQSKKLLALAEKRAAAMAEKESLKDSSPVNAASKPTS